MIAPPPFAHAGPMILHNGATLCCHRALVAALPEQKLGIVLLANSASALEIFDEIATEALQMLYQVRSGQSLLVAEPGPPRDESGSLTAEQRQHWVGQYATQLGYAKVSEQDGQLRAEVAGSSFDLRPGSDGSLGLRLRVLGLIPVAGPLQGVRLTRASSGGHEAILAHVRGHALLVGEQVVATPLSAVWRARFGTYQTLGSADDAIRPRQLTLYSADALLLAKVEIQAGDERTTLALPLTPLNEHEAVVAGVGSVAGQTMRWVDAGSDGSLQWSGFTLQRQVAP